MGGALLTRKGSWQVPNLLMREQCTWQPGAHSVLSTWRRPSGLKGSGSSHCTDGTARTGGLDRLGATRLWWNWGMRREGFYTKDEAEEKAPRFPGNTIRRGLPESTKFSPLNNGTKFNSCQLAFKIQKLSLNFLWYYDTYFLISSWFLVHNFLPKTSHRNWNSSSKKKNFLFWVGHKEILRPTLSDNRWYNSHFKSKECWRIWTDRPCWASPLSLLALGHTLLVHHISTWLSMLWSCLWVKSL